MTDSMQEFTAPTVDPKVPIIKLEDIHVIFKTRTGSILHPNKVHAVNGLRSS